MDLIVTGELKRELPRDIFFYFNNYEKELPVAFNWSK